MPRLKLVLNDPLAPLESRMINDVIFPLTATWEDYGNGGKIFVFKGRAPKLKNTGNYS